ncbi:MAG: YybS family protein [Magnetococcus sp. DMHC-6]
MLLQRVVSNPVLAGSLASGMLILSLLSIWLSPLQLLLPLPILLTAYRLGPKAGMLAMGFPVLAALALGKGSLYFPIMTLLIFGLFPILSAWLLHGGWQIRHCATVAYLLAGLLLIVGYLGSLLFGIIPTEEILLSLHIIQEAMLANATNLQGMDPVTLSQFRVGLGQLMHLVALFFPTFFLTSWFLIQVGNLILARNLLTKWQEWKGAKENLNRFRLPFFLVWILIGAGLLAALFHGNLQHFSWNVLFFLITPYFIQGLAIFQSGFQRYQASGFLRGTFYAALILWWEISLLVTVLGLFDTWLDFRNRFPTSDKEDGRR